MDELPLWRRVVGYVFVIFTVWFFFLGGRDHLWDHPTPYYIQDALVLLPPTIVVPITVGLLSSLCVFSRAWRNPYAFPVYLALVTMATAFLMSLYVSLYEESVRFGMLVEQETLYDHEHGGLVELMILWGGGSMRTLFVAFAALGIASIEIGLKRRALGSAAATALDSEKEAGEYRTRYHLPDGLSAIGLIIALLLAYPVMNGIVALPYYLSQTGGDPIVPPQVIPETVTVIIIGLVIFAVFAVWYIRLVKMCRKGSLVIGPTSLRWMSGDAVVREVDWHDISAVSHLRAKPIRFLHVITPEGNVSVPASCLDSAAEVVGLIREYAQLTEERRSLMWVRYERLRESLQASSSP